MNIYKIPLLACHNYSPERLRFPCYIQPKLNGIRAQYLNGQFLSRDRHFWKPEVVRHITKNILKHFQVPQDVVLDGEFYHHGWTLGDHVSAINVNRMEPNEETLKVSFCIFDWWSVPTNNLNFTARMAILVKNQMPNLVPTMECYTQEEVDRVYENCIKENYEGTININKDCLYREGKSWDKLKRKVVRCREFVCIGVERGNGKYFDITGSLVCKIDDGSTFKVGSGIKDKERKLFWANKPIGKLITVEYQELSETGKPLNPRFLSVRDYE